MSIGLGIFLLLAGAILRFAVNAQVGWLDLALTGNLLMIAGAVVTIIGLIVLFRRRRTTVVERSTVDGVDRSHVVDRADDPLDEPAYATTLDRSRRSDPGV